MYFIEKETDYGILKFQTFAKKELGEGFQISNEWICKKVTSLLNIKSQNLFFLKQTHSSNFFSAETMISKNLGTLQGDAIFSRKPGAVLLVKTADCLPVVLYSEEKPFYAIIHAGWRGLISGIVEQIVQKAILFELEIKKLKILIGPYASSDYEVEDDVASLFFQKSKPSVIQISEKKYKLDFLKYLQTIFQTKKWDISIESSQICTLKENEFFSHRKGNFERNLNLLYIKNN